ncbi:MAG: aspartate--ammonia ligase [Flavobacteriaceae bacterium]
MRTLRRSLETEQLITFSKVYFEKKLQDHLNLVKVSAPLFVSKNSGLNDDLNGVEKAVSFSLNDTTHEIVHSLAKWKRWYLGVLGAKVGEGIVTDMKAIRADEHLSAIHSHLVDQWDWEKVISKQQRTINTLITHGKAVYEALKLTDEKIAEYFSEESKLPEDFKMINTEELYKMYPDLSAKEREHAIAKRYGAVLLVGIGGKLSSGEVHDYRAPDYDDWTSPNDLGYAGLNADLLVWDTVREKSLEISSMGIRVDEKALAHQLHISGQTHRSQLPFHKALLNGELPYTIGGGIGQSRVVMFVTKNAEISTVQPIFEAC